MNTIITGSVGLSTTSLPSVRYGAIGRLEEADQLKVLDRPEPHGRAQRSAAEGPENAGAQFLEVVEEGHFPRGSRS